ncbi:DUF58 domain-containing protein [Sporosarcina sp. ACRSL]|uniref:DUF58 domain-containing protein n=1 Tax=Sporosarcina sp. ACRSL TaxID=2918215 RepID=UPI001EF67B58|nr:DUF58 domain-containing protein [Sporosarcina sp. ACRSL]MCG7342694.1 DUF58 domain-containing protein [Sporosarcina sp. ACRSL]
MKWKRYEHGFRSIHQGMAITIIFFVFAFIYLQVWLAACFAAVFAMLAFQNIYFSKIGEGLTVKFRAKQKRILIGEEEELVMEFENGAVPIWNGTLTISLEDAVAPSSDNKKHYSGIYDLTVPFAIGGNKKVEIRIPLEGKKRGMSRVTRVMLEIPHLFGDGFVNMELNEPIYYQSLVYPKVNSLGRELTSSPFKPGETEQKQSLFMDAFQPIGTRDYVPTDRFDQIHWTASARMQKLQTKEFLPVSSQNVVLMLNTIEKERRSLDFETKIERLVSYADFCMKHGIPYSVAINIRSFGSTPYLLLPSGTGKVQFQKLMLMLVKISDKHAKLPFEEMLLHMESSGQIPQTVVLITHETNRMKALAKQWEKRYEVILDNSHERNERIWDSQHTKKTETDSTYLNV